MRPNPSLPAAALLALVCLPACSSTIKVPIQIEPSTARVYINGALAGQGDRFVYDVDFGTAERICIQAAAKGYEPRIQLLTREQLEDQLSNYKDIRWTLIQERQ